MIPLQEPLRSECLFLPRVQMEGDRVVDLLLKEEEEGIWVLLLDASEEEQQFRRMQQQANEFSLFKERLGRGIAANPGSQREKASFEGLFDMPSDGALKNVAFLVANVREGNFSRTEVSYVGQLEERDRRCRSLTRICWQLGGVVQEEGWGGRLSAVFGVFPAGEDPAEQAGSAALEMREAFRKIDSDKSRCAVSGCGLSVGIATGEVIVGMVGQRRRSLRASGEPEERAVRLAGLAQSGEIAVDSPTYTAMGPSKREFAVCADGSATPAGEVFACSWAERSTDGSPT